MQTVNCPNCGKEMVKVEVKSHYGADIMIDQCGVCGGLWFDNNENASVGLKEHGRVEALNDAKLLEKVPLKTELYCPKDGNRLKILNDHYFPKDVEVDYCPECYGFWFNRGEFTNYQKAREEKMKVKTTVQNDAFEKQIDSLLNMHSDFKANENIGKIGGFLSTPIASRNSSYILGQQLGGNLHSQLAYGAYLVISSLMKIVLRKK